MHFPEDNNKRLKANSLIMQPFNDEPTKYEAVLELQADLNKKIIPGTRLLKVLGFSCEIF